MNSTGAKLSFSSIPTAVEEVKAVDIVWMDPPDEKKK
jgi:hypothetical protein